MVEGTVEFQAAQRGQAAGMALELLLDILKELEVELDRASEEFLKDPDPNVAIMMAAERGAYQKLRRKLQRVERKGVAAATALRPMMERDNG